MGAAKSQSGNGRSVRQKLQNNSKDNPELLEFLPALVLFI